MSDAKKATPPPPPPEDAPAAPAKKAGGSKLVPALVGVNSLVMLGVLGLLAMQTLNANKHDSGSKKDEKVAEKEEKGEEKKEEKGEKKEKEEKAEGKEEKGEGGEKKEAEKSAPSSAANMGPMVKVPDFVIHLRNPEVDRYARLSFDVEVFSENDKETLNKCMSKVRDAFIAYLSDRTVEELRGSDGLTRTKDALQTRLRELVPDVRVRALYISDFVIQ